MTMSARSSAPRTTRLVAAAVAGVVLITSWASPTLPAFAEEWQPPTAQQFDPIPVKAGKGKAVSKALPKSRKTSDTEWPDPGAATAPTDLQAGADPEPVGDLPVSIGVPADTESPEAAPVVEIADQATATDLIGEGVVFTVSSTPGAELTTQLDYTGFAGTDAAGLGGRLELVQLPACALTTPEVEECLTRTPLTFVNDTESGTLTADIILPDTPTEVAEPPAEEAPAEGDRTPDTDEEPAEDPAPGEAEQDVEEAKPAPTETKPAPNEVDEAAAPTAMAVVAAAAAAASSDQGDFAATSLKTADTWSQGGSSGTFNWSYPISAPTVPGGLVPALTISYTSGRTDGAVSSTNNQSSWIGEGFDLTPGFIERKYIACADDQTTGNNNSTKTGDLCWFTDPKKQGHTNEPWDNATLQLAGHAGELVRVGDTAEWRLKDDDGTRITKVGATGAEYWRVTTVDGTQYYFGRGTAEGSSTATNAVWKVPVFGNHTGEPSRASSFGSSWAQRPWRWNLDYVVTPTGDTMTFYWAKEANQYKRNNATKTPYERGGYLNRIEYGQRKGSENVSAVGKVEFTVKQRCDTTKKSTCETQTTSFTAAAWPDVPLDAICTTSPSYCPSVKTSPTFFTRLRLSQIKTSLLNDAGNGYITVDTWDLTHSFPDPGDSTSVATLWPSTIKRTGHTGTALSLPVTTLTPVMLHNRITGSSGTYGLRRPRLGQITNETGAVTQVTYAAEGCTPSTLPTNPATNTTRCFPVHYSAGTAAPTLHWFSKYVVSKVEEIDSSAALTPGVSIAGLDIADRVTTSYSYPDGAAWHYEESAMTPKKYRTWGVWRGYDRVVTTVGVASEKTVTENRWFRGMDGDWLVFDTTTKPVKVTDSTGVEIVDAPEYEGFLRETRLLTTTGGVTDSRTIHDPVVVRTRADDGRNKATVLDTSATRTWQRLLPTGGRATLTETLEWDSVTDLATKVQNSGDLSDPNDDTCTRTSYATPAGASLILDRIADTSVMPGSCATAVAQAQVLSWTRITYDSQPSSGTVGLTGLPTRTDVLTGSATRAWATTQGTYDQHGRPLTTTDALGRVTTTAYTPATARPVTSSTVTSPDPDGAGLLTAHVTTSTFHPLRGVVVKQVQPGGQTTEADIDGLGRVVAVWQPGRAKSSSASVTYAYTVNQAGLNAITTSSLMPNGTGYRTVIALYDSLLRPRQAQTQATSGRQVSDLRYTSRGLTGLSDSYLASGAPAVALVAPTARTNIKTSTRTNYDYAGRPLAEAFHSLEVEQWRTAHTYSGDRERIDPPAGGTPTTSVTDVHGRTTALIEHLTSGNATTSYSYDTAGNLVTMTDTTGNKWQYTWDLQANRLTVDDPDAGHSVATYDVLGNTLTRTDARGITLSYSYDQLNRPTATTSGATTLTTTSYDTVIKGQATQQVRYIGSAQLINRTNTVDTAGRPTSTSVVVPSIAGLTDTGLAGNYTTTATYNPDGSLATTTLPAAGPLAAETLTYSYNTIGLPTKLVGSVNYATSTLYTQWDTIASIGMGAASGHAIYQTFNRDEATMRLTEYMLDRQAATATDETTTLVYDPMGNITSAAAVSAGGVTDRQCFRYDSQRQLVDAWTPATADCAAAPSATGLGGPAPYWSTWVTTPTGKTSSRTDRTPGTSSTTNYTYPADGPTAVRPHFATSTVTTGSTPATASYTADAAGRTTSRPGPSGTQTLTWDDAGELTDVTVGGTQIARMIYDASGSRVLRRSGTATTLYLGGTELTATGATVTARRYYSHAGQTIAMRTGTTNAELWTLLNDHQGTTHHQVRNSDSQLNTTWQNPYGAPRGTAPTSWVGERGFVGGTQDATGMTRIGARDYDPALQRFVTTDPLQDLADPLQWNAYLYANNSPITHSDPTGRIMTPSADRGAGGSFKASPAPGTGGGGNNNGGGGGAPRNVARVGVSGPGKSKFLLGYEYAWQQDDLWKLYIAETDGIALSCVYDCQKQLMAAEARYAADKALLAKNWAANGLDLADPETAQGHGQGQTDAYWATLGAQLVMAFAPGGIRLNNAPIRFNFGKKPTGPGGIGPVLKGQAGVNQVVKEIEAGGGKILGREITVEANGVRTRPDLFVETACGVQCFVEVKTGPYARLTKNQTAAFPAIQSQGFIPRGANAAAAGLTPGAAYGPMPVYTVYLP